eukprot:scaffold282354_cov36-Tisochrysis_lutea.AAC.2
MLASAILLSPSYWPWPANASELLFPYSRHLQDSHNMDYRSERGQSSPTAPCIDSIFDFDLQVLLSRCYL